MKGWIVVSTNSHVGVDLSSSRRAANPAQRDVEYSIFRLKLTEMLLTVQNLKLWCPLQAFGTVGQLTASLNGKGYSFYFELYSSSERHVY